MSPSGSLAEPANETLWPCWIVTLPAGDTMTPLGGRFVVPEPTVMVRVSGLRSVSPEASVTMSRTR